MKVVKNKRLNIAETIQSPTNALPTAIHTGCVRLIRIITNIPAPKQMSYTGNIKLG